MSLPASGRASGGEGQADGQLGLADGKGSPEEPVGSGASSAETSDAGASDAGLKDSGTASCVARTEVCDGLDNACDGEVDPGATCATLCAGFALQGHGYMFCSEAVPRSQALARCAAEGMRLAWLETPVENEAVRGQIVAAGLPVPAGNAGLLTQIGASDAANEGDWLWVGNDVTPGGFQFWSGRAASVDGQVVGNAYVAWSDGDPSASQENEDCMAVLVLGGNQRAPGEWDDRSCNEALPFVCEVP